MNTVSVNNEHILDRAYTKKKKRCTGSPVSVFMLNNGYGSIAVAVRGKDAPINDTDLVILKERFPKWTIYTPHEAPSHTGHLIALGQLLWSLQRSGEFDTETPFSESLELFFETDYEFKEKRKLIEKVLLENTSSEDFIVSFNV
jgi:hypothetical protein